MGELQPQKAQKESLLCLLWLISSWNKDDLSEHGPLFDQLVPALRFRQGQYFVDDGFQLAAKDALHNVEELMMASHRGTQYLNLPEKDLPQISLGSKSCRCATRQHTSAAAGGP